MYSIARNVTVSDLTELEEDGWTIVRWLECDQESKDKFSVVLHHVPISHEELSVTISNTRGLNALNRLYRTARAAGYSDLTGRISDRTNAFYLRSGGDAMRWSSDVEDLLDHN